MRSRITLLVAATSSAIVVAFVIPLCLLVRLMAEDRAISYARDQAQSVAGVVATVTDPRERRATVDLFVARGVPVSVVGPDGTVFGTPLHGGEEEVIAEARTTQTSFTDRHAGMADIVVPVTTPDGVTVVHLGVSQAELQRNVVPAWWAIVGVGVILVVSSVIFARRLGERVAVPVTDVADVAHRLRAGDLAARATPAGPAETVELGEALNQLADRIVQLVEQEREGIADLGHRLRTPITALRLDTEQVGDPEVADRLRHHVDELHRSVDQVIREARRRTRETLPSGSDIVAVVRDRIVFWGPLAEDQGRVVTTLIPFTPIHVAIPEGDLTEAVDILVDNVFAHTPDGTPFTVEVRPGNGLVTFEIRDRGPGPATTAPVRGTSGAGSTGLGLDIVGRVAESVGGELRTRGSAAGGFVATVALPTV